MNDAMTAGELLCALAAVVFLGAFGAMAYRTRMLARFGNLAVMATKYPSGSWRTGMVRYRTNRLEWFSFRSLGRTPERVWERGEFVLGSRQELPPSERPRAMSGDAVSVDVEYAGRRFSIAMAPGDYTALRSWSESAPPGYRTDCV